MQADVKEATKTHTSPTGEINEDRLMKKVSSRLIPYLFILYILAYLNRVNLGYAALQMNSALNFDAEIIGFGGGLFFIGYFFLQIPGNMILRKIGARKWIAPVTITWGLFATFTMFVYDPNGLYILRFLTGAAQAGFFPGIILYLTYWYPEKFRARTTAFFMMASTIAGIVGSPVSGYLLKADGFMNLAGWQWIFLAQGAPAVILGIGLYFFLTDKPAHAEWLTDGEKSYLINRIEEEEARKDRGNNSTSGLMASLKDKRVWLMAILYFSRSVGLYGIGLWLPDLIRNFSSMSDLHSSIMSALPYALSAVAMIIIGAHSDRTGERPLHVAACLFVSCFSIVAAILFENPIIKIGALSIAFTGMWGISGPFWALPGTFLRGAGAAGGIALINSVGNLGGFAGPFIIGLAMKKTGSFSAGLYAAAGFQLLGTILAVFVRKIENN